MGLGQEAASSALASSPAPIVHAIGGSLGSALALLLFYPLERARIEMQSAAANKPPPSNNTATSSSSSPNGGDDAIQTHKERIIETTPSSEKSGIVLSSSSSSEDSWTTASEDRFVDAKEMRRSSSSSQPQEERKPDSLQQSSFSSSSLDQKQVVEEPRHHHTARLSECFRALWQRGELYRGVTPIVSTLASSNFIFFFVNAWMKQLLVPRQVDPNHKPAGSRYYSLLASCLAGTVNVLATNPLWLVSTRISIGSAESSSLWTELLTVMRKEGLPHLWKGTGSSILLVSNPVIQFFLYDQLKDFVLLARRRQQVGSTSMENATNLLPLQAFFIGALAKAVATVCTYPLQLTQAILRLQQQKPDGDSDKVVDEKKHLYKGIWDCLKKLYLQNGPKGWYAGLKAKLLLNILTAAFTFLTYEEVLASVHLAHRKLLLRNSKLGSPSVAAAAAV